MDWKDAEEVFRLNAAFKKKLDIVMKMFPGGLAGISNAKLKPDEIKAIDEANQVWEKLKSKVNSMGGFMY